MKDVQINANNSDIVFEECFFYNDFRIDDARGVSFSNCTFVFDSEVKKTSVNVNALVIDINNVYVDDMTLGDSIVRYSCDTVNAINFVFRSVNNPKSVFDVHSRNYSFTNSSIDAKKNFYDKPLVLAKKLKKD